MSKSSQKNLTHLILSTLLNVRLSYILIFLCLILIVLRLNRAVFNDYPSDDPWDVATSLFDGLHAAAPSDTDTNPAKKADKASSNETASQVKSDVPSPKGPHSVEKNVEESEKNKQVSKEKTPVVDETFAAGLMKRSKLLEEKEKQLDAKEKVLAETQKQIDQLVSKLDESKKELQAKVLIQTKQEKDNIAKLVKWYESMKPNEAATIFDKIDIDILFQVSQQMNQKKMSAIMAIMDIERVKVLNLLIARAKAIEAKPDTTAQPPKA